MRVSERAQKEEGEKGKGQGLGQTCAPPAEHNRCGDRWLPAEHPDRRPFHQQCLDGDAGRKLHVDEGDRREADPGGKIVTKEEARQGGACGGWQLYRDGEEAKVARQGQSQSPTGRPTQEGEPGPSCIRGQGQEVNGMKLSIQVFEHDDNKSFRLLGAPSEVFEHDDNKNFPNIV